MSKYVIYVRGTSEIPGLKSVNKALVPNGMLEGVQTHLNAARRGLYTPVALEYQASYANPLSYGESRDNGVRALKKMIDDLVVKDHDAQIFIVGYSQGAVVAGNVCKFYSSNTHIRGVYLLADALRPEGADHTGMRSRKALEYFSGYGVAGSRPIENKQYHVRWYSLKDDVICDARSDSLIRNIADFSEWMGFTSLAEATKWMGSIVSTIQSRGWQNVGFFDRLLSGGGLFKLPERVVTSIQQGAGYPRIHTDYWRVNFPGRNHNFLVQIGDDILNDS